MKINRFLLLVLAFLFLATVPVEAVQRLDTVRVRDFGVRPDTGLDAIEGLRAAIEAIGKRNRPTVLCFERGRYDFYAPEGCDDTITVVAALRNLRSLTIDGCGAEFVAHGRLSLFQADECQDLTIRNFSLDWQRPYITQATIVRIADDFVDLAIDPKRYPYCFEKGEIRFTGETWKRDVDKESYSSAYDPQSGAIFYGTRDFPLSAGNALFRGRAFEVGADTVRFMGRADRQLPVGTALALYHGRYLSTAITVAKCRNVHFENIDLYHSPGVGIYGLRCENIRLERVCTVVNKAEKRRFSCVADAFHFTGCGGLIDLDACDCDGQGDDALNVHGTYVRIVDISADRKQVELRADRFLAGLVFEAGDDIWPIRYEQVSRGMKNRIETARLKSDGSLIVTLRRPLEDVICPGDYVENASWCPDVRITGCRFGRANRARGILLTTPGKVEVSRNHFGTAGTAILIEGDLSYWFESGAICDMDIHDNVFENCGTSASNDGGYGWGEAVISITPSSRPQSVDSPPYHRNIRIRNNLILTYDRPLLHARSVGGLHFSGNRIESTDAFPASAQQRETFLLEGCRDVHIRDNDFSGYGLPDTKTWLMLSDDITDR